MSIGADPPTSQRPFGSSPSRPPRPPALRTLLAASIAATTGIWAGFAFRSAELGMTTGAVCLSVLRDLWPSAD